MNLNTADVDELAQNIPGLGKQRAQHIIDYREQNGPFQSWDDLNDVPGFSDQMVEVVQRSGATLGEGSEEEY